MKNLTSNIYTLKAFSCRVAFENVWNRTKTDYTNIVKYKEFE